MFNKPNFLCIGMQKAGTTTFYKYLDNHPQCEIPFLKEISFFTECEENQKVLNFDKRLKSSHWLNVRWRLRLNQLYNQNINLSDEKKLFFCNYLFSPKKLDKASIEDYVKLFPKSKNFISGDISPSYLYLKEDTIKKIKFYFPNIKIILIIRNPIEREWSQTKMMLSKRKKIDFNKVKKEKIVNLLKKPNINSELYSALLKWYSIIDSSNIKLLFYKDILHNQKKFYTNLTGFLNIDYVESNNIHANKGVVSAMPKYVLDILKKKHEKQITLIKTHLKNYPEEYFIDW